MSDRIVIEPDLEFIHKIGKVGGKDLNKCYQCATCSVTCELSPDDKPFPRKEMLWAQWGMKDRLLSDPDIWLCHQCNDCSKRCPRGARPGDVLAAIRSYLYECFTFPKFMGKAVANPSALPVLILVPMIIIAALIGINMQVTGYDLGYYLNSDTALLTQFLPSGYIEILFIGGNILIFALLYVGLRRFWVGLNHESAGEVKIGFIGALIKTVVSIARHTHFESCILNKPRKTAHLLVMYGFIGAFATTGMSLVFGILFGHLLKLPIGIETPIDPWTYHEGSDIFIGILTKLMGAASGIAIIVGSILMLNYRRSEDNEFGVYAYPDRLFLQLIFWTGLTGMLSWFIRLGTLAMDSVALVNAIAYLMYYVHIVLAFMLLWYMPYLKFAHMLYRTLAIVWAEQRGRTISIPAQQLQITDKTANGAA